MESVITKLPELGCSNHGGPSTKLEVPPIQSCLDDMQYRECNTRKHCTPCQLENTIGRKRSTLQSVPYDLYSTEPEGNSPEGEGNSPEGEGNNPEGEGYISHTAHAR